MLLVRDHAFEIFPDYKLDSPNKQKIAAITTIFFMFLVLVSSMKEAFDIKAISTKKIDIKKKYIYIYQRKVLRKEIQQGG